MIGLDDTESRIRFAHQVTRLRRMNWPWPAIAQELLGSERYIRGVKKLSRLRYIARLRELQAEN